MPREDLAAEIGSVMAGMERDLRQQLADGLAEVREEVRSQAVAAADLAARTELRLAAPREVESPIVPDEMAPLIGRAIALLAEAPPIVQPPPAVPAPVVNVTVPLPPQPAPRTERSRVQHDAQGRVVAIERDVA